MISNNCIMCTWLWEFERNCAFTSKKHHNIFKIFSQISKFVRNAVEVHISHIKLVSVLHSNTSISGMYWRTWLSQQTYLELCHRIPHTLGSATHIAKPDWVIQLNCRYLCTHASSEIANTWESFKHQGIKLFLLSNKLWFM